MRYKDGVLWVSADDTYDWAHRVGARWPGSTLSGHRLRITFEQNGDLVDLTVDGRQCTEEIEGDELSAFCDDMREEARKRGEGMKDVASIHRLRIARQTLKMNPVMVGVLGGMTIEEAKRVMRELGTEGERREQEGNAGERGEL